MLVNSLEKTFRQMIFKPIILLPMLIFSIVAYLFEEFSMGALGNIIRDILFYGETIQQSNPIFFILYNYPIEVLTILVLGIVSFYIGIVVFIAISKFAKNEKAFEAINDAVVEWKRAVSLTFFVFVVGIVFFGLTYLILVALDAINSFFGNTLTDIIYLYIGPIILFVLLLIFVIKIAFVLPSFADGKNIKESIAESWAFSNGRFASVFVFILVTLVIFAILLRLFNWLSIEFDTLEMIFIVLGNMIYVTFFILATSNYFYLKQ